MGIPKANHKTGESLVPSVLRGGPRLVNYYLSMAPPELTWTDQLSTHITPGLAAIAAFLAAWVAYRQSRTERAKLKLDLFEKRIAVYNEVSACLGYIFRTGETSNDNDQRFIEAMHQAKWLFGADVRRYLQSELWPKMCDLHCVSVYLDGMDRSAERTEKIEAQAALKLWFAQQGNEGLDRVFGPYLSFDKWK